MGMPEAHHASVALPHSQSGNHVCRKVCTAHHLRWAPNRWGIPLFGFFRHFLVLLLLLLLLLVSQLEAASSRGHTPFLVAMLPVLLLTGSAAVGCGLALSAMQFGPTRLAVGAVLVVWIGSRLFVVHFDDFRRM